jgi:hypothetical protein
MLKLKRIDLLIKNNKIHNKSKNGCIRKMSACVEKRGIFLGGWVVVCSLGGESWDGEEEGEIEEERVGRVWIYWLLLMESPMDMSCRYTR